MEKVFSTEDKNWPLWLLINHNLRRCHMDAWSSKPNHLPRGHPTKIKAVTINQKKTNLSNPFPCSDWKIRRVNWTDGPIFLTCYVIGTRLQKYQQAIYICQSRRYSLNLTKLFENSLKDAAFFLFCGSLCNIISYWLTTISIRADTVSFDQFFVSELLQTIQ